VNDPHAVREQSWPTEFAICVGDVEMLEHMPRFLYTRSDYVNFPEIAIH